MSLCQAARCRGLGSASAPATILPRCSWRRNYVTSPTPARPQRRSTAKERQLAERDQLIQVLKESPGKRDARNFLKHFDTPAPAPAGDASAPRTPQPELEPEARAAVDRAHQNEWQLSRTGVNLGNLYEPTKAIHESPVFAQSPLPEPVRPAEAIEPLHIALVKLRQPQLLDDEALDGIALTLSQMARLGMNIALVVDCDEDVLPETLELSHAWEDMVRAQCTRIVTALEEYNEAGAFEVDHALTCSDLNVEIPNTVAVRGGVKVENRHLILPPIEEGIIPVIPPWAYNSELKKVRIEPDDVVLALTREFAGFNVESGPDAASESLKDAMDEAQDPSSKPLLDRIIILDPLGGLPSDKRPDGAHVFINLEAEYRDVREELARRPSTFGTLEQSARNAPNRHSKNLDIVQKALRLLPPSSSALIITPAEAAISSQAALLTTPSTGVRTRRNKNPLIHNLLTDKPMISSSLPTPAVPQDALSASQNRTTFLKKGIPLTIIPDPRFAGPWQPPSTAHPSINLETDPRINFPKLVDLIEDSFRRKLDAHHYLARIRGRVAGLIIAGDYEGGAICTWELPAGTATTTPPPPDSPLWVPYLDKFAVLTKSQGSGGVADIVWGALTRTCFPSGLVWRSRTDNPVNKWYFERAKGVWNLPGGQWTMFWTTNGVVEDWARKQSGLQMDAQEVGVGGRDVALWDAYIGVCGNIAPSWADGKKPD